MLTEYSIDINADPTRVWEVMTDIERWPDLTRSVNRAELLQRGPLKVGSEARISQPRLDTRVWRVTAVEPGSSFTWETSGPGAHMVASHELMPRPGGGSLLRLAVDSGGGAVALFGWPLAGTARRYVEMEAAGVKGRSEQNA